ncbi:envelope integrity protein Cei [Corynebacterium sp. TAE3-ERU12]|uniref:envelope integrity protein Cei n=1 Tax=Corynebacterium sp. TAE3-ERU12 TaxID=2849491 RepID=UPI001C480AF5|nr:envelope integrity protein Cei [Corynebacterium sp. TAE3-ERU12]MBV7295324.1 envelope integrity protein Cei [Corynebacterium sp. TAE3-ERU12]
MKRVSRGVPGYNPLPYYILLGVLIAAMLAAWVLVATRTSDPAPVACGRAEVGRTVPSTELFGEPVARPNEIPVRVLNANGEAGDATRVADKLSTLGFMQHPEGAAGNDPVITEQDLNCHGQLRFGPDSIAKAHTLHVLVPCFELIDDGRTDGTVDMALGRGYTGIEDAPSVTNALNELNNGADPATVDIDSGSHEVC